jgi:hypothetical protein
MIMNFDDLVEKKLVIKKEFDFHGEPLYLYKYHNRVFYDNLWRTDERLLEARGIILNADGEVVQRPFKKVFNYGENGMKVHRDKIVRLDKKYNGFMAAATMYKGNFLVSTTGSMTSKFVDMAKEYISPLTFKEGYTSLFEVCHEDDPHIVHEYAGAYLLATRDIETGELYFIEKRGALYMDFSGALERLKSTTYEGFMVIDPDTGEHLCKLKSPHYLSKKFLMRGQSKIFHPNVFEIVDEEFYPIVTDLREKFTKESWNNLDEQERRVYIEAYFNQNVGE